MPIQKSEAPIFIRSNPALILHPLQDMNLWNGREWAMGRFAQAFRSIPAGKYERLHGQGRDVNVWMAVCHRDDAVYGYIANPQSWEVAATVSFTPGTKVTDLINSREVQDELWEVTLAPYTMHTFRLAGAQGGERILGCTTKCEQGQARLTAMLADAETNLAENARLLEQAGTLENLTGLVKAARQAVAAGDYSKAYEIFSLYPCQVATQAVRDAKFSPFITRGWKVSRLMPKSGKLSEVPGVRLADDLGWKSMDAYSDPSGGGVIVRSVYEEADGIAYLGTTIKVHKTGAWTLSLGHDGGCRMFVDGKPALCQAKRKNPIVPDRSKVTQELSAGNHEIMIALDTDNGLGWGIKFRFATPDGKPIKAGEFPVAGSP